MEKDITTKGLLGFDEAVTLATCNNLVSTANSAKNLQQKIHSLRLGITDMWTLTTE